MGRIPPLEERAEDYAPLEERLDDFAPWVDDRDETILPGDAEEVLQVIPNLSAAESGAAGAAPQLYWSDLNYRQVVRLWNAVSFHMWQYGEVMSAHIIIAWRGLEVTNHANARHLLGQYLNRCQKWARVGFTASLDLRRQLQWSLRQSRYGDGFNFRYVFTNECSGTRGFHSHILASVPDRLRPNFEAWSRQTLAKLAKHPGTAETVMVVPSNAKNEHDAVERQWHCVRYICKQLEPEPEPSQRLRNVLRLWPYRSALPMTIPADQLTGASRDIRTAAQRAAGFLSELTSGDLTRIYDGHELEEYRARLAADKDSGLIRAVETTPANEADVTIAPSIIPDAPGEVYADKAYDALSVEKAIEAKGGTSKLMRKGHRWLPAERLEAHNRPLRPIRARIEKIFGTWKRSYRLRAMRWMGLAKAKLQVHLASIAYNLKRHWRMLAV
jgi:Transposase DDE domain